MHGMFERLQDRTDEVIKTLLARAGEEFITLARSIRTYKDRTGNLRSSTGYAIFKDGRRVGSSVFNANVGEPGKKDGEKGVTAGEQMARAVGRTHSNIIRKTICPKSQNDLSEDWGDTTAFFGRVVFGWFVYP